MTVEVILRLEPVVITRSVSGEARAPLSLPARTEASA